jgi:hypothetical protein
VNKEDFRQVGIFLDYTARDISFYNVTARSHIWLLFLWALQSVLSLGTHDRGKNMDLLAICPVGSQGSH